MEEISHQGLRWLVRTALLFALTLVIQMLGLPQFFTGPLVNAFLLLAALLNGIWSGVIIGLFTPWIAFARGILAPPLGPMIPFIMAGNAILVIVFSLVAGKRKLAERNNRNYSGLFLKISPSLSSGSLGGASASTGSQSHADSSAFYSFSRGSHSLNSLPGNPRQI